LVYCWYWPFFLTHTAFAQQDTLKDLTYPYQQAIQEQTQQKQAQVKTDAQQNTERQKSADDLVKEYKAKAKETRRINDDANDAVKQAKRSAKMEKQAQKSRINAEKQMRKAEKAAEKSDRNWFVKQPADAARRINLKEWILSMAQLKYNRAFIS